MGEQVAASIFFRKERCGAQGAAGGFPGKQKLRACSEKGRRSAGRTLKTAYTKKHRKTLEAGGRRGSGGGKRKES